MILKRNILLLLAVASALFILADTGQLYSSDKLSSSLISCICQDRQGYIWIGTEYGLNRFDGYHHNIYLHREADSTSIADNIISSFLVSRDGNLWIGTRRGLMRYNYRKDCFEHFRFPGLKSVRVSSMQESPGGDIMIGTGGRGLFRLRKGSSRIEAEKDINPDVDGFFTRMLIDSRQTLWRGDHNNEIVTYRLTANSCKKLKTYQTQCGPVSSFLPTGKNTMLIVCHFGILQYDYMTNTLSPAGFDLSALGQNNTMHHATCDHDGNIYIGTSEKGLMCIERGTSHLQPVESSSSRFNLATADVNNVLEDKDQNLWMGCYGKGVYLKSNYKESFNTWSFSAQNHIIGGSVTSIATCDDGSTLCSVSHNGIYRFDAQGHITGRLNTPAGTNFIYRDREGSYWIATDKQVYSYNPATGAALPQLEIDGSGVRCMEDNGQGELYVSNFGKGLLIFNKYTREVRRFSMNQTGSAHGRLTNDWVGGMHYDRRGLLWICTANGLSCMNPKTHAFDVLGWTAQLKDVQCNVLLELNDGEIIIGTDDGVYRYNVSRRATERLPATEHLKGYKVCAMTEDADGDIWMSSVMGIWMLDRKKHTLVSHTSGNGLTTKEYINRCILRRADGLIGFATNDGITTFYPHDAKHNALKMGSVHLTNFVVGDEKQDCSASRFVIPSSQSTFYLELSLLNYKNTENIRFEYRLNNGSNGQWQSTEEGINRIYFNRLKPGSYTLEVRAAANGEYSAETRIVKIRVEAPWYATSLAYLFYALLLGALVVAAAWFYRRRQKRELEEAKMRFLINATHDIRSPLTLIMGPVKKLKRLLANNPQGGEALGELETIDRNANRLLMLVNQILDQRKIDKNQMQLHCRETELSAFVGNIASLYQYNAAQRNITLNVAGEKLSAWIDRMNFDKVITNLLSNAFKFTPDGGNVSISIAREAEKAVIRVSDTGSGLPSEKPERLFERFYQGKNADEQHNIGTGIGLNLCRTIVKMHGGDITAGSRTDGRQGAVFTVSLPLGNAHLRPEEIEAEEPSDKKKADRNVRIMLVDDDPDIARYISHELGGYYRFEAFRSGEAALQALLTQPYDLIISDVMMPEMDGIELLKRIKSNKIVSDVPVILLTSKADVADRLEGLRRGADAYIAKPFNMDELRIQIDNLIANVRRLRGKFSGAQDQEQRIERLQVTGYNDALMDRITRAVNENLSDRDFNVERLCQIVGISRTQLHRKMKEITGISSGDFVRNIRLDQAAKLIRENKVNISEVAYRVGFANQAHFSTTFKKHFGVTPKEYAEGKGRQ